MGNQVGIKKLAIGTGIDSNRYDTGIINGSKAQIYGGGIPQKETTATAKVRSRSSRGEGKNILQP